VQFVRQQQKNLRGVWERLRRVHRLHGFVGLCKLLPQNLAYLIDVRRRRQRRTFDEFDRRFGVETATRRSVSTLDMPLEIAVHASRYESVARIDDCLQPLDIAFDRYTFIDYGCGKGRALLMASDYPFARIIGVEYSAEMAAIARRNIASYRNPAQRCHVIDVVEADAAVYQPPQTACVFFLYNPFDAAILRPVLERIRQRKPPERLADYLIYVDPRLRTSIESDQSWGILADHGDWVIYQSRDLTAGSAANGS
jgi:SAM-dependent methyltransferase